MTSTVIAIVCANAKESRAILLRHGIPRPPNTTTTNNLLRILLLLLRTILPETHIRAAKVTLDQGAGLDDWEDYGTTACVVMIIPTAIAIVTLTRFGGRLWFGLPK